MTDSSRVDSVRGTFLRWIDQRLAAYDLALVRRQDRGLGYLDADSIISAADAAGLNVNDYLESRWPGHMSWANRFLDFLLSTTGLDGKAESLVVCEIGPGTGRHLQLLMARLRITRYEVYETNPKWRTLLRTQPCVFAPEPTGEALGHTRNDSVDLFHAHSILTYLPFLVTVSYLDEAARIVKPGGILTFDLYTEGTMTERDVIRWRAGIDRWPVLIPSQYVKAFMERRGCELIAGEIEGYGSHESRYFIFRKTSETVSS